MYIYILLLCGCYAYTLFYFRNSMTRCADSAISGVKMLYHVAKNAISCGQECCICQCVHLELKVTLVVSHS